MSTPRNYISNKDDVIDRCKESDHNAASNDRSGGGVSGQWSGPSKDNGGRTTRFAKYDFVRQPPCLVAVTVLVPPRRASPSTAATDVGKADKGDRHKEERRM